MIMKNIIGIVCMIAILAFQVSAQTWVDISSTQTQALVQQFGTQAYPGGCSGVCVNRFTGDVVIKIIGWGMWRSTDKGATLVRIDNNTVSGRCETGWGVQVDQNDPRRMAVFSLDGDAGYTSDGITWKKMAGIGRNWDFGSVDWGAADARVMITALHESGGQVYKTTDGAVTWTKLPIVVVASGGGATAVDE